jgi:hypothetical protein
MPLSLNNSDHVSLSKVPLFNEVFIYFKFSSSDNTLINLTIIILSTASEKFVITLNYSFGAEDYKFSSSFNNMFLNITVFITLPQVFLRPNLLATYLDLFP